MSRRLTDPLPPREPRRPARAVAAVVALGANLGEREATLRDRILATGAPQATAVASLLERTLADAASADLREHICARFAVALSEHHRERDLLAALGLEGEAPSPSFAIVPDASWPWVTTSGKPGPPKTPSIRLRSEWQMPQ